MPIKTIRVAYKVGFSSALTEGTFSAYGELAKWEFEGEEGRQKRLVRAFCKGYQSGVNILFDVKYRNKTEEKHVYT